jgi:hypothetical protein
VNDGEVLVEFVCLIPKAALTAYYIGRAAERSTSEALSPEMRADLGISTRTQSGHIRNDTRVTKWGLL